MALKYYIIFLLFFTAQTPTLLAQQHEKMLESDVKAHCQCLEDLEKEIQRKKKKAKRNRKKEKKKQRPLGGESIDVSMEDCLVDRRSVRTRNLLLNMTKKEQIEWNKTVLQKAKKKCPRLYARVLK